MGIENSDAKKLVQEGIDLSSDVMDGIYKAKKKKLITFAAVFLVVLAVLVIILFIAKYPTYAVTCGVGGMIILVVLIVYKVKELQALKRELDALYHYISY